MNIKQKKMWNTFVFLFQLRRAMSVKLANEQTYCVCVCPHAAKGRCSSVSHRTNSANKPQINNNETNWTNITANRSGVHMSIALNVHFRCLNENTYQVQQLIKRSKWFKFESFSVCISTCGRCYCRRRHYWHRSSLSGSLQMQISYSPAQPRALSLHFFRLTSFSYTIMCARVSVD